MLKVLSKSHEFGHGLSLELLDVFVLFLKLTVCIIFESTELERLVRALVVNFLLQVVLAVVDLLHDVLFTFNSSLYLTIELVLQTYTNVMA